MTYDHVQKLGNFSAGLFRPSSRLLDVLSYTSLADPFIPSPSSVLGINLFVYPKFGTHLAYIYTSYFHFALRSSEFYVHHIEQTGREEE